MPLYSCFRAPQPHTQFIPSQALCTGCFLRTAGPLSLLPFTYDSYIPTLWGLSTNAISSERPFLPLLRTRDHAFSLWSGVHGTQFYFLCGTYHCRESSPVFLFIFFPAVRSRGTADCLRCLWPTELAYRKNVRVSSCLPWPLSSSSLSAMLLREVSFKNEDPQSWSISTLSAPTIALEMMQRGPSASCPQTILPIPKTRLPVGLLV